MPISDQEMEMLNEKAMQLRMDIVDVTFWAGGAHIGGALSMVEILVILYYKFLNIDPARPDWEDRDRFVLSKGHAGVGYAPLLSRKGYFEFDTLRDFNNFKSPFGMHLDALKVTGVDLSTGSLGHGLPMAGGLALGARFQKKAWTTYCVLGDGECNEGSIWEAAMAASHYRLTNLVTIVDRNKYCVDGNTEAVMGIEPFCDKWRAFGFDVQEVDGHDFRGLERAIEIARAAEQKPVAVIAHTIKGKGVDFMEDDVKWHYGGLDSDARSSSKKSIMKMYGK